MVVMEMLESQMETSWWKCNAATSSCPYLKYQPPQENPFTNCVYSKTRSLLARACRFKKKLHCGPSVLRAFLPWYCLRGKICRLLLFDRLMLSLVPPAPLAGCKLLFNGGWMLGECKCSRLFRGKQTGDTSLWSSACHNALPQRWTITSGNSGPYTLPWECGSLLPAKNSAARTSGPAIKA